MPQPCLLSPLPPRPEAPLFVFLPGMDGSGTLLHRQVADLAQYFDIRCLSLPRDDCSDWQQLTASVVPLIREAASVVPRATSLSATAVKTGIRTTDESQLEPDRRPVYLCGESFGACLALLIAQQHPALIQRFILINPASSFAEQPLFRLGSWASELLPPQLYSLSAVGLLPWLIAVEHVSTGDRRTLLSAMQAVHPQTAAWRLRLLRNFNLGNICWEALQQPALLLAGERDRLLPSRQEIQRIAQRLPRAQTRFLPQSGHACLLEQQVNLAEILCAADFLEF